MIKNLFLKLQVFVLGSYEFNRLFVTYIVEFINIIKKRKLIKTVSFNNNEKKEIKEFYRTNYGKSIPLFWHRLYQSYTGKYNVNYFPEILFSTKIEKKMNPFHPISGQFGDKNLLLQLFGNVQDIVIPNTLFSCVNGVCRDNNNRIISKEKLIKGMNQIQAVIKKSIDSSSGRDVLIINSKCGRDTILNTSIETIVNKFGNNFVVQEIIKQNEQLSHIYAHSLNTFRVITYILNGIIHVCPISLRIGRGGTDRDNIHYGGICVGVDDTGRLRDKAFTEYGERFEAHPDSGVVFSSVQFDFVMRMKTIAIKLHSHLPWLGIISWDFSVNQSNEMVLIEMNTTGQSAWFPQMVNGEALFGNNTIEILQLIKH